MAIVDALNANVDLVALIQATFVRVRFVFKDWRLKDKAISSNVTTALSVIRKSVH